MRHGAQKVGFHLFRFRFRLDSLLPLHPLGQHADDKGYGEHRHKGQRVTGYREIEFKIRIGKRIVDPDHRHNRRHKAEQKAVRQSGNQQHRQHKDHRHRAVAVADMRQQSADHGRQQQNAQRNARVAQHLSFIRSLRNQHFPTGL